MRILHVGWGFTPWRGGGLIRYAEDVMEGQARAGHEVTYVFSGRRYPWFRRPRLHRWRRAGVGMLEIMNAPLAVGGTHTPELDLAEPQTERLLRGVIARVRPDVMHVQELAGLPSAVIDLAHEAGVPVVFTLQDYFGLCPTFKLFDADGRICDRLQPGPMCQVCCAAAPGHTGPIAARTAYFEADRVLRRVPRARAPLLAAGRELRRQRRAARPAESEPAASAPPASASAYQRRRDVNVERLGRVDALVATSTRVAEMQRERGVDDRHLSTVHLTVGHVDALAARRIDRPPRPVHFATLNGASGLEKGVHVIREALEHLDELGLGRGEYRLTVFGAVDPGVRDALERHATVDLRGIYTSEALDGMLADVDVGLVPSIWEEPYAHTGLEFLAKGIPVIANARGGLTDYTLPGVTGWLNASAGGRELADIMSGISRRPEQVLELHRSVVARRAELIKPLARHLAELDEIYAGVIERRRGGPRA